MKRVSISLLAAVFISGGLLLSPSAASAQGVAACFSPTAPRFTSSAPSGSNGFVLMNSANLCFDKACGPQIRSPGTNQLTLTASAGINLASPATFNGATVTGGGATTATFRTYRFSAGAIGTCAAGSEGETRWLTGTGGTNTGAETRFCACVSNGAASPAYSWRNLITGTAGNATTCNP